MTYLAQTKTRALADESSAVSARDIAERFSIPKRLLAEVMKDLVHEGLVRSVRGATGGYRLAAPAEKTTVLSVLQALEGPFEMVPCTTESHGDSLCELLSFCPIKGPIQRIHEKINAVLTTVTLADLARGECADRELAAPHAAEAPSL
jgi:Rrf2 family protein